MIYRDQKVVAAVDIYISPDTWITQGRHGHVVQDTHTNIAQVQFDGFYHSITVSIEDIRPYGDWLPEDLARAYYQLEFYSDVVDKSFAILLEQIGVSNFEDALKIIQQMKGKIDEPVS